VPSSIHPSIPSIGQVYAITFQLSVGTPKSFSRLEPPVAAQMTPRFRVNFTVNPFFLSPLLSLSLLVAFLSLLVIGQLHTFIWLRPRADVRKKVDVDGVNFMPSFANKNSVLMTSIFFLLVVTVMHFSGEEENVSFSYHLLRVHRQTSCIPPRRKNECKQNLEQTT